MLKSNRKIYLDYAASALPNPSSIHSAGVEAKKKLEDARKGVADILGTVAQNIIFTSGGTESNNLAIQGIVAGASRILCPCALRRSGKGRRGTLGDKKSEMRQLIPHIITTNIEHSSVLEVFRLLEKTKQAEVTCVPVEPNGIVDPRKIQKALRPNTVLVSVMYANNEIGTIEPIREIAKEIRHYRKISKSSFLNGLAGVGDPEIRGPEKNYFSKFSGFPLFHTDAVQAANYLDLNVEKLGVDLMTISGSKIEGGGSVGVLYLRKGVPIAPIFGGGDQEMGLRPGTENWAGILKFAKAFKKADKMKEKESKRLIKLRDYFIDKLMSKTVFDIGIKMNGDLENRLPNNVNITIPKIPSDLLVLELSARGIYVSEKSACQSGDKKGSYVIEAIHDPSLRPPLTKGRVGVGSLRFSMGSKTTKADIDHTFKSLSEILQKLKKWYTR